MEDSLDEYVVQTNPNDFFQNMDYGSPDSGSNFDWLNTPSYDMNSLVDSANHWSGVLGFTVSNAFATGDTSKTVDTNKTGDDEGFIGKMLGYLDKHPVASNIAAGFVKGFLAAPMEKRKTQAMEKAAKAQMLNAETNAFETQKKFQNASSIGSTSFGQKQTPQFVDLLAKRRQGIMGGV